MRIGIDARLANQTGVGRYIRNLIKYLQLLDKENDYVLFVRDEDYDDLKSQIFNSKFQIVRTNIKWHSLEEQFKFPGIIDREKIDIMHFPYFSVPLLYRKPFVVTVHDLIIDHFSTGKASSLSLPLYFLKRIAYMTVMTTISRKAKMIISPSKATKEEIISHYKIPGNRIKVTYEGGFDMKISNFKPPSDGSNVKYKKYFLYVGNAYPHKNLSRLIDAFAEFTEENMNEDVYLVLVGKEDYFYKRLKEKLSEHDIKSKIIFLEEVSDKKLVSLYKSAIALVIPSLMEGFGLTALEAMSVGCLVLASENKALSEICGNGAYYFKPTDTEDLKEKMKLVYRLDKEKILKRKEVELKRSKNFSWEKMAVETLKIYENSTGL